MHLKQASLLSKEWGAPHTAILIVPAFYELLFNPIFAESARYSMYMLEGGKDNPILFGITFAVLLIILFILVLEQKG